MKFFQRTLVLVTLFWQEINGEDSKQTRIINGKRTSIENYSSMAILFQGDYPICGGSIINKKFVLTAAHCLHNMKKNDPYIRCGSADYHEGDRYKIEKTVCHEKFTEVINDIGLIKIQGEFSFSNKIQPIPIATMHLKVKIGDMVNIAGWGIFENGKGASRELLDAEIPIYDKARCSEEYSMNLDKMLCAGTSGTGTCNGDSGGPLIFQKKLIGVVSFGDFDCTSLPGVFTDVRKYNDWIDKTMKAMN